MDDIEHGVRASQGEFPSSYPEPPSRAPFLPLLTLIHCVPAIGMAPTLLELTVERVRKSSRALPYTTYDQPRGAPVTHQLMAHAATRIDTA